MLTLEQFKAARATLRGVIRTTSLIHSPALSRACLLYTSPSPRDTR